MKITLHNTERFVTVNGAPARIWEGHTESGIPVYAAVSLVAVHRQQDNSQFENELREITPASAESIRAIAAREII